MFTYNYKIITPDRQVHQGEKKALFAYFIRRPLEREGNVVIYIQRTQDKFTSILNSSLFISMSSIQRILFFRNLSMMLDSGIALSSALLSMVPQAKNTGLRKVYHNIYTDVSNGGKLSKAMARYPSLFPLHLPKTIEVGEESGTLSESLDRISIDLERSYELRRKVVGAITYPLIIVFFMIAAAVLLIIMVLPQIVALFAELDAPLPTATRVLQSSGIFMTTYPLHLILTILLIVASFSLSLRVRRLRLIIHALILRIPIFGNLIREYTLSVFTRSLGTLLASGITFVQALDIVKGTIKNESYVQVIENIHPIVLQGGSFSDAIKSAPFHFPEQLRYLIEVGEQSGKMRISFEKASSHYDRSVLFQTQMLTTVIEPILMILAGVMVGFLAYSIFGPLYGVATFM